MATKQLNIKVTQQGAQKAEKEMNGLGKSVANTIAQYAGLAAAGYAALKFFKDSIDKAAQQEQIFRRLATSINLTGISYKSVEKDLQGYFEQLQRTTEYGDTESAEVLTTLIQLTGDYEKSIKALPLALDLSATALFDTGTAAKYIAMAMEGNVEMLGRLIPELKAANSEIVKNGTNAEKAAFAMELLNEKFGGTAQENVQSYAGQMKQLSNRLDDVQENLGNIFLRLIEQTGVLGITEQALRKIQESWLNLSPALLLYNMLTGEAEEKTKKLTAEMDMFYESMLPAEEFTDYVTITQEYAQSLAEVGEAARMNREAFEELKPVMERSIGEFPKHIQTTAEKLSAFSGYLLTTFDYVFTETLIREQNFMDAMVAGFVSMLERMLAELLARAAVFGVLNFLTGGSFGLGVGGFGSFITAPITGIAPAPSQSGGGGNNITMNFNSAVDPVVYKRDLVPMLKKIGQGVAIG